MATRLQLRRDTAANWTAANPVLAQGEIGVETDTTKAKFGDGLSAWASLGYWTPLDTSVFITITGSETLTNKTLTSPVINTPTVNRPLLNTSEEVVTVSATAATGTINFDAVTQSMLYYTSNASANFTLNVRGNSSTTLASILGVGQSLTVAFMNTNGSTAYYATAFQIDGNAVTPKWQGGNAPNFGNGSAIDVYTLTIIKTAATPTYTVLASFAKFA